MAEPERLHVLTYDYVENVYEKLGARSRTHAVLTAWSIGRAHGLVPERG